MATEPDDDDDSSEDAPMASNVTPGGRVAKTPMRSTPPPDPQQIPGGTFAQRRAGYEARAAANNPSLTPLHRSPAPMRAGGPVPPAPPIGPDGPDGPALAGAQTPAIAPTGNLSDANAGIDLLQYGRDNNIPRPGVQPPKPPAPNQSEANTPLTGSPDASPPGGSSVPFNAPFAPAGGASGHVGGTGSYQRNFSNPESAGIYHNFVSKLFANSGQKPARTGLRQSPAAVA